MTTVPSAQPVRIPTVMAHLVSIMLNQVKERKRKKIKFRLQPGQDIFTPFRARPEMDEDSIAARTNDETRVRADPTIGLRCPASYRVEWVVWCGVVWWCIHTNVHSHPRVILVCAGTLGGEDKQNTKDTAVLYRTVPYNTVSPLPLCYLIPASGIPDDLHWVQPTEQATATATATATAHTHNREALTLHHRAIFGRSTQPALPQPSHQWRCSAG